MKPSIHAQVVEAHVVADVAGHGRVVRLVINLPGTDWQAYTDAGLYLGLQDDEVSPAVIWVESAYQVPFEETIDLRLLIACPADGMSDFQQHVLELQDGASVQVSEPVPYPFYAPINARGKLILLAAGCDVSIFRPLVKKIYDRDIEWMGEVRAYTGSETGIEQVYLNNKNVDVLHYLDDSGYRAFDALMARSSATVARLGNVSRHQAVVEFVRFLRSPSTYVYVAGQQAVLEQLGQVVDSEMQQPGTWQRIQDNLLMQNHWYRASCNPS